MSHFLDFHGLLIRCFFGLSSLFPLFVSPILVQSQPVVLKMVGIDYSESEPAKLAKDSLEIAEKLRAKKRSLISAGYLTAGVDSLVQISPDTSVAYIFRGRSFKWGSLKRGNIPEEFLTKSGFREKVFFGEVLNTAEMSRLVESILDQAENTGYPFAEVFLDSVEVEDREISATLNYQKHDFVVLDSLIIKGNVNTNRSYIENYIGFKKNRPYDQSTLRKIPSRIKEIPFVKSIKPYEVGMRPGKADVYLYLDEKKASSFDGVLGVLPDPETGDVLITGDVKLNLLNSLKRGETINIRWQRLRSQTQQLDLHFKYPFLFRSPIGIDLKFNLYRRDTTFSQNSLHAGLECYFTGINTVRIFYQNISANTIGDEEFIATDLADSRTNMVGIGTTLADLDYRFNPRSGYYIEASLAAGEKKILNDFEEEKGSDETDIYNLNFDGGIYFPLFKRSAIFFRFQGGHFDNERMFRNEIYRIGGLKTLRGFDEQAIFATSFAIGSIEYRFILEQNSNIFLFFDQAYYEDTAREDPLIDRPFGFGGGINFETNAGVFSLTYALGRQFDNNINFRGGKIHFGFVSFF